MLREGTILLKTLFTRKVNIWLKHKNKCVYEEQICTWSNNFNSLNAGNLDILYSKNL